MTTAKRTQVMSIIQAYSGQQNVVPIPRVYIEMTGDYAAAALLNQILYWSERTNDADGWFYKSYADWQEELCLSQYQVNRIIDGDKRSQKKVVRLRDLGVETMLKKSKKGAPTVHYRIDESVFVTALTKHLDAKNPPIINNVDNPIINNVNNPSSTLSIMDNQQRSQSLRTEITTEIISESTKKKKESAATPQVVTSPYADTSYQGLYCVIAKESFQFGTGDKIPKAMATRIGKVVKAVMELEPAPSVAEMNMVYRYAKEVKSDTTIPKGEVTLVSLVQEFRKSGDYQLYKSYKESALNKQIESASAASAPTMTALDHKHAPEWIAAQPDYGTPEENAELDRMFADLVSSKRSTKLVGKIPPVLKDVS